MVFVAAILMSGVVCAAKSDNAAQGTKALMKRIELLEAAVASLGATGGSVSGGSYLMVSESNHLWAGNEFPGHGVALSLGKVVYDFYADGTGLTQVLSCDGNRLHDPDFNNTEAAHFEPVAGCQTQDLAFTYVQDGNELYVQFSTFPFPIEYIVSENGNMFVGGNVYSNLDVPCEDPACTLSTAGTIVNRAMRIGPSE